jgi:aspartate/methionine/tyrosine aminotransferase
VAGERLEILRRRNAARAAIAALPGWRLLGCGAYFAYVEHPFEMPSDALARDLVRAQSLLMLPGTMFAPTRAEGGDGSGERQLRIAFANVDVSGLAELGRRLAAHAAPLPPR